MEICPHFGPCGGCSRQDVAYERQLAEKEKAVRRHLAEHPVGRFHPIIPSPDIFYYRNKMEFSFGDYRDLTILSLPPRKRGDPPDPRVAASIATSNEVHIGLHPKGRFALVTPTPECRLISVEAQKVQALVRDWANERSIPIFVRKDWSGDLRHLVIREGKNTGERMVTLVAKSTTPHMDELAERLRSSGVPVTTFLWSKHDGLSDVARGDAEQVFWGTGSIREKLGEVYIRVAPHSFMQTNTHAAERMIALVKSWLGPSPEGGRKIIDLYCGSGVIGLNLAGEKDRLVGIEINTPAVESARETAAANGRTNAVFIAGKAEDIVGTDPAVAPEPGTCVVVDPPRAGLHPRVVDALKAWAVPHLVYVSCNPESLARDLRGLEGRYTIHDVQPMDFFPHTDHIETAVRLELKTS